MKKQHLKPFWKKFFSFLAAGTFVGSAGSLIVHNIDEKEEEEFTTIETLDLYKINIKKENQSKLEVVEPRDDSGLYHTYNFNINETLSKLKSAIPIFYKYKDKSAFIKDAEIQKEFNEAMRTIFDLNINFVELENMIIKQELSSELQIPVDQLNILFELDNLSDEGRVSVNIKDNHNNLNLSDELESKIKEYKSNILLTQNINFDELSPFGKQNLVNKIIDNISSSRETIIRYFSSNDIKYIDSNLEIVKEDNDVSNNYEYNSVQANNDELTHYCYKDIQVNYDNYEER